MKRNLYIAATFVVVVLTLEFTSVMLKRKIVVQAAGISAEIRSQPVLAEASA